MIRPVVGLVALIACVVGNVAHGHDYWLAPGSHSAIVGRKVAVHLFRGEAPKADDERPLQVDRVARFALFAGDRARDLLKGAEDGRTPVVEITPEVEGGNLVAMVRRPATIMLDAKKFNAYLKDEGLDAIVSRRAELGESRTEGRERYRRYLKALIQVGDRRDATFRREVGHRLEILLLADPSTLKAGDPLQVRVLFEGKPLADARVFAARCRPEGAPTQSATTDRDGRATFRADKTGPWLVRLVHMRRAPVGDEVEWESFWTAYTFGIGLNRR